MIRGMKLPLMGSLETDILSAFSGPKISHLDQKHNLDVPLGFPGGSVVKNLPANEEDERDVGSIPGLGRSPGGGSDNPLQYSYLGKSMDRGACQATVRRVAEIWT